MTSLSHVRLASALRVCDTEHCMPAVRYLSLLQRSVHKTMQVAKYKVSVAESAPQTDTRLHYVYNSKTTFQPF